MKKKLFILLLLLMFFIMNYPIKASSGDGLSFRINDFHLGINWSWQEEVPSMYDSASAIPLINLIHSNYSKISSMNKEIYFEYGYNELDKTFYLYEYHVIKDEWQLIERREFPDSTNLCSQIIEKIKKELNLSVNPDFVSNIYVVFIPSGYYFDPDSTYKEEVEDFLNKSELYYAHNLVTQQNVQGYIYSIFFDKHRMYSLLDKLNVKRIIINRKTLDDKGLQTFDVTLY